MANPAMFNVTFTITYVKQESISQAIYRLAGKFTFGKHVVHWWNIVVATVYFLSIEYI